MSDAELSVTLKNATFAVKDGKMVFDKIDAITRIGGTYMKDGSVKEFTDLENPEGITSEGLTEALNEVALPSDNASNENPAGNASNKNPAGNASNENPKPADAVDLDNLTEEQAINLTQEQAAQITEEQARKYSKKIANILSTDNANINFDTNIQNILIGIDESNGGSKRSRKARRTKKGGKKRRSTQRRQRKYYY
jgi:hypothetical protein